MRQSVSLVITGLTAFGFSTIATIAGCLTVDNLQGGWRLIEIQSQPVRPIAKHELPFFTITGQSIEGFDGCNNFWGHLDQPGSIASTRIACVEGYLKLPLDLTDPLSHLKAGRIEKGRLILPERGVIPASIFERVN